MYIGALGLLTPFETVFVCTTLSVMPVVWSRDARTRVSVICLHARLLHDHADINECLTSGHTCHSNATCNNTAGSYTCACKNGFLGDGRTCRGKTIYA